MNDVVIIIGRLKVSLLGGIVFSIFATVAAATISHLLSGVFDFGKDGSLLLPFIAVIASFPIGSFFGYKILYSDVAQGKVAVFGTLVPLLSTLALVSVLKISDLNFPAENPGFNLFIAIESIWNFALETTMLTFSFQIVGGLIIYPFGIIAAYIVQQIGYAESFDIPRTITLFANTPRTSLSDTHEENQ
jgi:hypothetical protein